MSASPRHDAPRWQRPILMLGAGLRTALEAGHDTFAYIGRLTRLLGAVASRFSGTRGRISFAAFATQSVRVGVRAVPIVLLVQIFVGIILALNLAPTLEAYGQLERVADVVAIAIIRELGPLITAILLSGFAGAAIAAELGAMVEGEEIKALKAHALDPVRFLVVPRVLATAVMLVGLAIIADAIGVFGGFLTAIYVLDVSPQVYIDLTQSAIGLDDYLTGLLKSGVFGMIIAALACYEGLNVRGGAEGVGRATTTTVVKCIVALIGADCAFAAVFYVLGW